MVWIRKAGPVGVKYPRRITTTRGPLWGLGNKARSGVVVALQASTGIFRRAAAPSDITPPVASAEPLAPEDKFFLVSVSKRLFRKIKKANMTHQNKQNEGAQMGVMTVGDAKKYFHAGALHGFRLERSPMNPGWIVSVSFDGQMFAICPQRSKAPRVFASLDTAISTVEEIGFKVVAVAGA